MVTARAVHTRPVDHPRIPGEPHACKMWAVVDDQAAPRGRGRRGTAGSGGDAWGQPARRSTRADLGFRVAIHNPQALLPS